MSIRQSAVVFTTAFSLSALIAGCGGDDTIYIAPSEKAQIKTDPTPAKTVTGKPGTAPKVTAD